MPQIIVTAGDTHGVEDGTVMLRERVNATDFESDRFAANLLERLGWAVEDATAAERRELVPAQRTHEHSPTRRPERQPEPAGIA